MGDFVGRLEVWIGDDGGSIVFFGIFGVGDKVVDYKGWRGDW